MIIMPDIILLANNASEMAAEKIFSETTFSITYLIFFFIQILSSPHKNKNIKVLV